MDDQTPVKLLSLNTVKIYKWTYSLSLFLFAGAFSSYAGNQVSRPPLTEKCYTVVEEGPSLRTVDRLCIQSVGPVRAESFLFEFFNQGRSVAEYLGQPYGVDLFETDSRVTATYELYLSQDQAGLGVGVTFEPNLTREKAKLGVLWVGASGTLKQGRTIYRLTEESNLR